MRNAPRLAPKVTTVMDEIVSPYLLIPMHKAGASANKVIRYSNVAALSTEISLFAGTEDYATRRGRLTGDGSSYYVDKTQAMADFVNWWDTDPKQFLMIFDVWFATTPANQYLFSFSVSSAAGGGGFGVLSVTGTNVQPKINTDGTVATLAAIQGLAATTEGRYILLWDGTNMLLQQALNANIGTPKSFTAYPTAVRIADGCSFMGRSSASSPGNLFRSGDAMGNIFMLKPTTDIAADYAAIVADVTKYPNSLARIFRGL